MMPSASILKSISLAPEGWPKLHAEALHGLAGDIVKAIEPHTEADPAALLVQLLVCFGNAIGRTAFWLVEDSKHYTNLFSVIVGNTSKARKGTSFDRVAKVMTEIDEDWRNTRIQHGLSSGEGLIFAVGDTESDISVEDSCPGLSSPDKRLLVFESEFALVLKVMSREGNTLSPTIRDCWDTGDLQSLQRNRPLRATGPHISIIGHITQHELQRSLTATESANGFGNRFLWVCARRSRLLPLGGTPDPKQLDSLLARLKRTTEQGKMAGQMKWNQASQELWCQAYEELSKEVPGILGSLTARSEAQVIRLACLYALLDCSTIILTEHLQAALALWQYCEDSARYLFSDRTGNPDADQIQAALRSAPHGLTLTEINRDVFQGHRKSKDIRAALHFLAGQGKAHIRIEATGGRSIERWFASTE